MRVKVHRIDNRGTADVPFGFVYFTDGNRLGFGAIQPGEDRGFGPYGLFASNWGDVPRPHYVAANKALVEKLGDRPDTGESK